MQGPFLSSSLGHGRRRVFFLTLARRTKTGDGETGPGRYHFHLPKLAQAPRTLRLQSYRQHHCVQASHSTHFEPENLMVVKPPGKWQFQQKRAGHPPPGPAELFSLTTGAITFADAKLILRRRKRQAECAP
jgi:hypothetical protein